MDDGTRLTGLNLTVVAVDKDKNSQQAVKWAIDHLCHTSIIILIHVRNKLSLIETGTEITKDQADAELNQLFLPYRGFCARKGMQMKEIVLEGADIPKAIVDYINANKLQSIVVGVSNRSLIMKKFRNPDIPSCLIKSAPDFCAVYVISKGSLATIRSVKNSSPSSAVPPRQLSVSGSPGVLPDPEESIRTTYARMGWRASAPPTPLYERAERRSLDRVPNFLKPASRERPLSTARSAPNNLFL